jgi:hypothetical protein
MYSLFEYPVVPSCVDKSHIQSIPRLWSHP